ncbi:hypothetical protein mRhiFer1_010117 [Rhinolophus ferrumequinum]|uniref:Uncharacterized protein n=1 Tax=Rhinolophus ferrumequinum TaxID=59479 RepID=A0A7J7XPL8_RHIFE|nr:hypothetical protein mRhiFer1_010117 [Rhinolophus ferrumequinum]
MPKGINRGQSCLESVEGAKGSYHPLPHSEHLPRARERISEEREGKRKAATTAAEVDPQLQGLRLTMSRGKGTWVDRKQLNPVTIQDPYPTPTLPYREREWQAGAPETGFGGVESSLFFRETHRSISRTILLLPSAGIILPLAQTQVSLVVSLDGGVRTGFNLSLNGKWPSFSLRYFSYIPLPREMGTT